MLLLMGRIQLRSLGNTNVCLCLCVYGCNSRNKANACFAGGTMCSTFIFIFAAGMCHSAFSKSISDHSAWRNSPGLTNTNGANFRANLTIKPPE